MKMSSRSHTDTDFSQVVWVSTADHTKSDPSQFLQAQETQTDRSCSSTISLLLSSAAHQAMLHILQRDSRSLVTVPMIFHLKPVSSVLKHGVKRCVPISRRLLVSKHLIFTVLQSSPAPVLLLSAQSRTECTSTKITSSQRSSIPIQRKFFPRVHRVSLCLLL